MLQVGGAAPSCRSVEMKSADQRFLFLYSHYGFAVITHFCTVCSDSSQTVCLTE